MYKIRLWKMIFYTVITLGIYPLYWLAKRSAEIRKVTKMNVPHWGWLIWPIVIASLLMITLVVHVLRVVLSESSTDNLSTPLLTVTVLVGLAVRVISIWWYFKFSQAVAKLTEGRLPDVLMTLLWVFWGFLPTYITQYHINRLDDGKKKPKGPSTRFKVIVIILIILGALSATTNWNPMPQDWEQEFKKNIEVNQLYT